MRAWFCIFFVLLLWTNTTDVLRFQSQFTTTHMPGKPSKHPRHLKWTRFVTDSVSDIYFLFPCSNSRPTVDPYWLRFPFNPLCHCLLPTTQLSDECVCGALLTGQIAAPRLATIGRHKWSLDCGVDIGFPPHRPSHAIEAVSGNPAPEPSRTTHGSRCLQSPRICLILSQ